MGGGGGGHDGPQNVLATVLKLLGGSNWNLVAFNIYGESKK